MKTKRTLLQWTGHLVGVILTLVVALFPTEIYAALWWHIPKTIWPIVGAVLAGIVWLVVQVVWGLWVAFCWSDLQGANFGDFSTDCGNGGLHIPG